MKKSIRFKSVIKFGTSFLLMMLTSVLTFAQVVPEKVDVNISTSGGSVWYGQPWIWAVGIAIFVLILVIITRSNKKSDA
jgi:putative copper export protein